MNDRLFGGWRWFEIALFWVLFVALIAFFVWVVPLGGDQLPPPYIHTTTP